MKLYLHCGPCGKKFTLAHKASTRQHLANQIGYSFSIRCPNCRTDLDANVGLVRAETSYKYAQVPTALGVGAIALFFGPLATVVGLALGAASGSGIKNSDRPEVNRFNNS